MVNKYFLDKFIVGLYFLLVMILVVFKIKNKIYKL